MNERRKPPEKSHSKLRKELERASYVSGGSAEATPIRTESYFGSLFDRIQIGVYRTTPDGQFLDVNMTLVEALGYPDRQALLDAKVSSIYFRPEDRIRWKSVMTVQGEVRGWEVCLKSFDGSLVYFEENALAIEDTSGRVVYFEGTLNDITERKRAEQALRESERRYRLIFENIQDVYYETTINGVIIDVSPSIEDVSGYNREDLIGASMLDLFADSGDETLLDAIKQHGSVRDYEIILKDKDGELLQCSVTARILYDDDGHADRSCGTLRNISERKKAEEERDRLLELTSERVKQLTCMYSVGRAIRKRETLAGVFREVTELIPTGYRVPEITRAKIRFDGEEYTGEPFTETAWRLASDIVVGGEVRGTVEVYLLEEPPPSDNGPFLKGELSLLDALANTLGEAIERMRVEERFRLAAESASDLIYEWIIGSDRIDWFGDIDGALGFDQGELSRDIKGWFGRIHPDDRDRMDEVVEHHRHSSDQINVEYRIEHKDGSWRYWSDRGTAVLDASGKPVRVVGVCTDITERKEAERRRLELERQIQHAQKLESLGVLAGGVAHDFNNLLMGVIGNAELMNISLPTSSPARTYLNGIRDAARRAAELSTQMLAYSGKGKLIVEALDLSAAITGMAQLIGASTGKKVEVRFDLDPALPPLDGDLSQLRQVVVSLVANASEAIGEQGGTISISTSTCKCSRDDLRETYVDDNLPEGCYIKLVVSDDGPGMDQETLSKIFEPFFTTKFVGRGLGLAALLGIVRGHHGAIKVASEVGKGTTVTVLFPISDQPIRVKPIDEIVDETWKGSGLVLLVDDEETVRLVTSGMLEVLGFDVITAADGHEAVDAFRQHRDEVTVVILDKKMPRMNGVEAYFELRNIKDDVKVILCSGEDEDKATRPLAGQELAGFIQKPFRISSLRQLLYKTLATS
jgi:PAS domain S-box-containing protein